MPSPTNSLTRPLLFVFAAPALLQGFMHSPASSLLQGIYAKHAGVPLAALGTAVLLTRIFDAVTDPVIGVAADAWYRRHATHKHFVGAGSILAVLGLWMLFTPPPGVGIVYFTGWFMLAYLGWTISEIPYRSWSMQLSSEYVQRARIQTWLGFTVALGTILFYVVPILGKQFGLLGSTEFDLAALALVAKVVLIAMPLVNIAAIVLVPDGIRSERERKPASASDIYRAIIGNGPLVYMALSFIACGLALGMGQGVSYLYIDVYLGLSEELAGIMLLTAPVALISIPVWGFLCQRFSRPRVWAVALTGASVTLFGFGFIPPGEGSLIPAASLTLLHAAFATATIVAAPALFGDVIDYGRWKFGQDHGSTYLSVYTIASKAASGVGVAFGLILLDLLGFDARSEVQSPQGAIAIRSAVAWLPALGIAAIVPLIWRFPITREKHAWMISEIDERELRPLQQDLTVGVAKSVHHFQPAG